MEALKSNDDYSTIPGICFRIRGKVYQNQSDKCAIPAEQIPVPYPDVEALEQNRIYYYETTRGCVFHCQFCLSGNQNHMMKLSLDRVFLELQHLIDRRVKQVKFVDRTFNEDASRTLAIWQFLKNTDNGITNFHFEINAALLNQQMLDFLKTVPEGLFQFEIGIQTTNADALKAIRRSTDQQNDFKKIEQLTAIGNIHLHTDLIAGLPYEDYFSFRSSFNDVFALRTDMVQLGFLKLLKGSGLRDQRQLYQYVYQDDPPYEVLESNAMTYGEILQLKRVEDVLERYWNSGKFRNTIHLALLITQQDAFSFFAELAAHWRDSNPELRNLNLKEQTACLQSFLYQRLPTRKDTVDDALRFDCYLLGQFKELPDSLRLTESQAKKNQLHDLLHKPALLKRYFPDVQHLPAKKLLPYVQILSLSGPFSIGLKRMLHYQDTPSHERKEKVFLFIYPRHYGRGNNQAQVIDLEEEFDENSIFET
ncbi:MAG: DUF4080 domain-containing protein [Bacillota bacterium]|nr:DUF4080 domain-containing protein [Bacillota bacterium]MDW7677886.1 DUF4080 domain-containing protein [Bacillota bacterium]